MAVQGPAARTGCIKSDVSGHISPPPFRWVVRAKSAKQACFFVHRRDRAFGRRSLGILWDRTTDYPQAPPLGKNLTEYWAVVANCRAVTISLWESREAAEEAKRRIDQFGCGGGCHRAHELVRMTLDEAKRRRPLWLDY